MTLNPDSFLGSFGFVENPFSLTNADEEPELPTYFVPPPYFASVLGSPTRPKSAIVFAPRGGGKTAQKVMIENAAVSGAAGRFLCLTYDEFDLPTGFKSEDASIEWHLTNIVKKLVVALLIVSDEIPVNKLAISSKQKNDLARAAVTFLSAISESDFRASIDSLRNWRGKVENFWSKYAGAATALLSALAVKFGVGSLDKLADRSATNRSSITEYLRQLIGIANALNYQSVYVLVDRIDETRVTSNRAKDAYDFVRDLLLDLHVLEIPGLAFKFFLWDQTRQYYKADGGRGDRVPLHELDWTAAQISEMLAKRLKSYSSGKVSSLRQLFRQEIAVDFHLLICHLAAGSPRDMIRMARAMVDEQTKTDDHPSFINFATAETALRNFARERSEELFPQFFADLTRISRAKFILSDVTRDFKAFAAESTKKRLQSWQDWGAVARVGELEGSGGDREPVFAFTDPRLVIASKSNHESLSATLNKSLLVCAKCGYLNAHDPSFRQCDCAKCGKDVHPQNQNLLATLNRST